LKKISLLQLIKLDPILKSTDQVLLTVNDDKVTVGTPTVKGASVDFEIVRDYQW